VSLRWTDAVPASLGRGRRLRTALLWAGLLTTLWRPVSAAEISCDASDAQGSKSLLYSGPIAIGEKEKPGATFAARFNDCFPKTYKGITQVVLRSGGGRVDEGLAIAQFLINTGRTRGPVKVTVPRGGYCISACTFLFVSGTFREVEPGASLEPHGFSSKRGLRIDRAFEQILAQQKLTGSPNVSRLWLLRGALGRTLASEPTLSWLNEGLAGFAAGSARADSPVERLLVAYKKYSPEQRDLLGALDSITEIVGTEVERAAALRAFRFHLDKAAGRPLGNLATSTGRDDELQRWMSAEYLTAINNYLAKARAGAPLRDLSSAREGIAQVQQSIIEDAFEAVNNDLWPLFSQRGNDIDVEGFVKLMFSTSIVYTRPVTREELCDLNLVNSGCE